MGGVEGVSPLTRLKQSLRRAKGKETRRGAREKAAPEKAGGEGSSPPGWQLPALATLPVHSHTHSATT